MFPTGKGKSLLLMNEHTYTEYRKTTFYCSKKMSTGCRAKVHFNKDGSIREVDENHVLHGTTKYMITKDGTLIKY